MLSPHFKFLIATAALIWTITAPANGAPRSSPSGSTSNNEAFHPVIQDDFADPAIITVNGILYTFDTNSAGINVPVATNHTGTGWHIIKTDSGQTQDAMPTLPPWSRGAIWAPDVVQLVRPTQSPLKAPLPHRFGGGDHAAFAEVLYTRVQYPDGSGNLEARGLQNEVLGLPKEDLDQATKVAIEMPSPWA